MSSQSPAQQYTRHQANQLSLPHSSTARAIASPSFPSHPGPSMDCCSDTSEGSPTAENDECRRTGKESTERRRLIIEMLPDDVLLVVLDFYMIEFTSKEGCGYRKSKMAMWLTLAHVCRRWRCLVFGSPRRLGLQLVCTTKTPTATLDAWPALPLAIEDTYCEADMDNFIALLERGELVRRITQIELWNVHLEDISKEMEVPFPELTDLRLYQSLYETERVLPLSDSFLGRSAPRLQHLELDHVPFPGLPKLLSSATHLTELHLEDIPHSGYISPEEMVACLPVLTSLGKLSLLFQSCQSRPNRESRHPPPPIRNVLPALTEFSFKGVSEYLEALVACVDAPRLNLMVITFFNDIVFDTPQFTRLICDTPTFNAFNEAMVLFGDNIATITLSSKAFGHGELKMNILCKELNWQVSFMKQVSTSSLSPISTLEDLYIDEYPYERRVWEDNIDNALWLQLLHPFTTVKNLFLSERIAPHVVPALQGLIGGRTTEVLPTLQNAFVEGLQPSGPVQESVGKFVAARQVTSHPIAASRWDREWKGDD